MITLGIESSCDETAFALVKDGRDVILSEIISQIKDHSPFGGVTPEIASRKHLEVIKPFFLDFLQRAGMQDLKEIDLIAVTQGPGLIGSLLVGTMFAKGLAQAFHKPLYPVNHVHAHIHGAFLGIPSVAEKDLFPCLSLVVSGGHTNLYWMTSYTSYSLIAITIDDACGECFDKVGKLLDIPYPAGPQIEKLAKEGTAKVSMPKMMKNKNSLNFSFSGLKTHMYYLLEKEVKPLSETRKKDICAAFQEEALGQLVRKIKRAMENFPHAKSLVISGGVSANQHFREMLSFLQIPTFFPNLAYCSDNAAMIASLAFHEWKDVKNPSDYYNHNWDCYSQYPFSAYMQNAAAIE